MKISDEIPRLATSRIPREVATRALLSPKMSGKSRRLFMRARDRVIDVERQSEQDNYCRKLETLTIRQLGRRLIQAEHALLRTERLLASAQLESFRKPLEDYKTRLSYRIGWLTQEAAKRIDAPLKDTIDDTGN